jgi:hypothetical protein
VKGPGDGSAGRAGGEIKNFFGGRHESQEQDKPFEGSVKEKECEEFLEKIERGEEVSILISQRGHSRGAFLFVFGGFSTGL